MLAHFKVRSKMGFAAWLAYEFFLNFGFAYSVRANSSVVSILD